MSTGLSPAVAFRWRPNTDGHFSLAPADSPISDPKYNYGCLTYIFFIFLNNKNAKLYNLTLQ